MVNIDIASNADKTAYSIINTTSGQLFEITAEEFDELLEKMKLAKKEKKKAVFISHQNEFDKLATSPRKALRIIALYALEKKIEFYSKAQVSDFVSRNIKAATILAGLPGERITRTIAYLRKNVDFKWTLETVVKYAEDIDNLSPKPKQGLGEFLVK